MRLCARAGLICLLLLFSYHSMAQQPGYYSGNPAAATNPAGVETLDLSHMNLTSLDSSVLSRFTNIRTLKLRANNLKTLPSWLGNFHNLSTIDLGHNRDLVISTLTEPLSLLPLRKLSLDNCNLVYLPEDFARFEQLEELDLSYNLLEDADALLFTLPVLSNLDLKSNRIDSIRTFNQENTRITWLDLSGNPCTSKEETYKKLAGCINLQHLSIEGCSRIPSAISRLNHLSSLDISNSPLKEINTAITNLENLERINLQYCPDLNYTVAFNTLSQLKSLKHIDIGYPNSKATDIPEQIKNLKSLRSLGIYNGMQVDLKPLFNMLAKLPELRELAITGGRYEIMPNEIFRLSQLEKLDFSDNQCTYLPFELNNMHNLKQLDIRGNMLKPDRVQNLEEALAGYCQVKSDFSNKPAFIPVGTIPLAGSPQITDWQQVNAETGGTVRFPGGFSVNITPGSLLMRDGTPATGTVNIGFRDLSSPLAIGLSGINMLYDSNGTDYMLSSAGMAEVKAQTAGGQELRVKQGSRVTLTMPTTNGNQSYNYYRYDPVLSTWLQRGGDGRNIPVTDTSSSGTSVPRKKPVFYYPYQKETFNFTYTRVKNDQTFTFKILNYETPSLVNKQKVTSEGHMLYCFELQAFLNSGWIYDGQNAQEDYNKLFRKNGLCRYTKVEDDKNGKKRSVAFTVVNDIRIIPNPDFDNFLMEFYTGTTKVLSIPVLPLKSADDPYSVQKKINRQYRKYRNQLHKRLRSWEKAEQAYNEAYSRFETELEAYRAFVRSGGQGSTQASNKTNLVDRTLEMDGFGVWNVDKVVAMNDVKRVRVDRYVSENDNMLLQPLKAVAVNMSKNSSYPVTTQNLYFDFSDNNIILFSLENDKIGVLYPEELRKLSQNPEGRTAVLKVIDCKGLSHNEIVNRIGL